MGICQGKGENLECHEDNKEPHLYCDITQEFSSNNNSDDDDYEDIMDVKSAKFHSNSLQGYDWTINPNYETSTNLMEEVLPPLPPKESHMSQLSNEDPIYDNARLVKHVESIYENLGPVEKPTPRSRPQKFVTPWESSSA